MSRQKLSCMFLFMKWLNINKIWLVEKCSMAAAIHGTWATIWELLSTLHLHLLHMFRICGENRSPGCCHLDASHLTCEPSSKLEFVLFYEAVETISDIRGRYSTIQTTAKTKPWSSPWIICGGNCKNQSHFTGILKYMGSWTWRQCRCCNWRWFERSWRMEGRIWEKDVKRNWHTSRWTSAWLQWWSRCSSCGITSWRFKLQ